MEGSRRAILLSHRWRRGRFLPFNTDQNASVEDHSNQRFGRPDESVIAEDDKVVGIKEIRNERNLDTSENPSGPFRAQTSSSGNTQG
jgi:hypothetical protein